ncbi:4-hydroxy-tetrahydrodipicolinate reductase [Halogeometricum borinquense]|uniref:4-hydroxy-tetrahydrodipicolinate reductase n=1 Tax=Halogeometricum borinquense TaxID=60847 RepID=A0A6C0UDZ8_9EURY|nr:4-hydroxy-tetrahydrodipicolinate reductase [Halogeometricum borinquense]QIB73575.1 4-hydroxy-tetrahydrodipicolinate reductase [Halogeometricum borinquense]QIQ77070.1 4-hydroxy-tetrahydrodipicolinate reductase [Halogeometricum borinquense]
MGGSVRVAITGAAGRMGRELIDVADSRDDVEVVLAVNRSPVETVSGVPVSDAADLPELLAETDPDVMVDFTAPESSVAYAAACAEAGVGVVVGTTGFDEDGHAALDEAAESVPLLHATNFSRGVAALRRAVREAVAAVPDYDVEVTETHHNGKRDAPSGTANTLLTEIDDVRGESERVYGREGDQPRTEGEIGVHARRAGGVTGEHEVLLADDHQLLSLTHRAGSRGVFAAGALDAAVWLTDRDAGRYDFDEVLDA